MFKAVLFDLDGTLADTTEYILQAFDHVLKLNGVASVDHATMKKLIGIPLRDCYQVLAPGLNYEELRDAHTQFQLENVQLIKLFPASLSILKSLRETGFKTGLVTTRGPKTLHCVLEQSGLDKLLDVVVGEADVQQQKPHPEALLLALSKLGVEPPNAVMVGDSEADIRGGQNAGMKTIGVTFGPNGHHVREFQPDWVVDEMRLILEIINKQGK